MTIYDDKSPTQARSNRLRFDRYVLDLDRGCLLLEGNEITLRPKTFAVLRHFVENSCRLVSKDELFAAVWPNLAITDDALVQSVGELRRALGNDGPRLIRTIPRRGYRFESQVSAGASIDQSSTDTAPTDSIPALDAFSDVAQSPPLASGARTPLFFFKGMPAIGRIGFFRLCSLSLSCLLRAHCGVASQPTGDF